MADTYPDYAALAAAEVEGVDYTRTAVTPTGSTWSAIAIHGGGIEGGSGEIAREVAAGGTRMAYYEFAGTKSSGNSVLHITSTNFDEPQARALVLASRRCLSFHGYAGTTGVADTAIGGLDTDLRLRVSASLRAAGFSVIPAPDEIAGTEPTNICNRTSSSMGVQLELSKAMRDSFFPGGENTAPVRNSGVRTDTFHRYAAAVLSAYHGRGIVAVNAVNASRFAMMPIATPDQDLSATVSTNRLASGGGHLPSLVARYADMSNMYIARLEFSVTQAVILTIRRRLAGSETSLGQHTTGLTHAVDRRFSIRFQVTGSTLRAKAWRTGRAEPGWQVTVTDTSLTAAGSVALRSLLASTNTNVLPVKTEWGDFSTGTSPQTLTVTRSANGIVKPQAAGTDLRLAHPTIVPL